jgi:imidazolonepropionase-like amidohydrolase
MQRLYEAGASMVAGKGRIAPGFDADILAADGDPVSDPEALHRIRAVYARGLAVQGAGLRPPARPR